MIARPLPCPNPDCGKDRADVANRYGQYSVLCHDCNMRGPAKDTVKEAIAAWDNLPREMRFKPEDPTVSGWYWWMNDMAVPSIAHVRLIDGDLSMVDYGGRPTRIKDCDLVTGWAGPLRMPKEA